MGDKRPSQLPAVTRTEVSYLDIRGNPTTPKYAVRVITREYDADGNLICTKMTLNARNFNEIY
ncbi:hypothetical protein [Dendrosporobacter sp. 1207_IL3150]|uniref:hypothetical protein n=1 Tax=Dendrosporobacter sp. 1207_IL3150 TaxID=3084054 RepID=UPI002FD8B9C5